MNLFDILKIHGFDITASTRLLRHQDPIYDIEMLFRNKHLEAYQSAQLTNNLNCDYVIAFIGREGNTACFAGIWRVMGKVDKPLSRYTQNFPYENYFSSAGDFHYELEPVSGFDDLEGRMIIDWGKSTRAWNQWLTDRPIIEILPKGRITPFPGYLDFVLSYAEMKRMIAALEANRVWHQMLGNVAGVYLITDTSSGKLYVGSAYGKSGILGRWREYAKNGHGGNVELKRRIEVDPKWAEGLNFTVLRTLPATLTKREVIAKEQLYKLKLGSKAHGLNLN